MVGEVRVINSIIQSHGFDKVLVIGKYEHMDLLEVKNKTNILVDEIPEGQKYDIIFLRLGASKQINDYMKHLHNNGTFILDNALKIGNTISTNCLYYIAQRRGEGNLYMCMIGIENGLGIIENGWQETWKDGKLYNCLEPQYIQDHPEMLNIKTIQEFIDTPVFWNLEDNKMIRMSRVERLGFPESDLRFIPFEYLEKEEFVVSRTCFGIGDWGIISAMPRLLKEKYPNCKVFLPSEELFGLHLGHQKEMWGWKNPFSNCAKVFLNNPYVDGFKREVPGRIYHDHYRLYNKYTAEIPLIEQMLKFWRFHPTEYADSQPELYFSEAEFQLGDNYIKKYVDGDFGVLILSDRYKYREKDNKKIHDMLDNFQIPYFYIMKRPIQKTPFRDIDYLTNIRGIDVRGTLLLECKSQVNIGYQSGISDTTARYTPLFSLPLNTIKHNIVKGVTYL